MEQYMWIVWLALMIVMIVIEASGPALVSIWFAAGALVSLICSFIPGIPWWAEIIIFVATSLIAFIALRPIFKKYFKRNSIKSNVDSLVGKKGLLTKEIKPLENGECKINDVTWTAVSVNDQIIEKDSVIEVVSIVGNKLYVKKVEEK